MQELILAIAGLILELLVFFCAGSLLTRILKMKAEVTMELVLGYLLYFAVFEILAVPMTLKWVKLSTFSYLWMVIMAACVLAACLFVHKLWKGQLDRIGETFRKHSLLLLLTDPAVFSGGCISGRYCRCNTLYWCSKHFRVYRHSCPIQSAYRCYPEKF